MAYQTIAKKEVVAKIGTKHQVVIPRDIFNQFNLQIGSWLEFGVNNRQIVLTPKQLISKSTVPKLNDKEQKILARAKKKVNQIDTDMIHSKGLTDNEIKVAVKVGLIDDDQKWWWHEGWQNGEREAERDIAEGRVSKIYTDIDEMIKDLNS